MSSKYKFVIDRSAPGGARITTALEYVAFAGPEVKSPFGPRHWCALEPRSNLPAPMTACGKVDSGMAFTTGINAPEDVTCPTCKYKLDEWIARLAARHLRDSDV